MNEWIPTRLPSTAVYPTDGKLLIRLTQKSVRSSRVFRVVNKTIYEHFNFFHNLNVFCFSTILFNICRILKSNSCFALCIHRHYQCLIKVDNELLQLVMRHILDRFILCEQQFYEGRGEACRERMGDTHVYVYRIQNLIRIISKNVRISNR